MATKDTRIDELLIRALEEVRSGHVDAATWARALLAANGDRDKASAKYIRARIVSWKDDLQRTLPWEERRAFGLPVDWVGTNQDMLLLGMGVCLALAIARHELWPMGLVGLLVAFSNWLGLARCYQSKTIRVRVGPFTARQQYTLAESPWNYWAAMAWTIVSTLIFLGVGVAFLL